jgi:galactokinase
MTVELDWQVGLAPEIRMALHGFQAEFGRPPATLWRVPGTVTLLANGQMRLTVATPWAAVAAAGPGEDGVVEVARMERPGERERLPAAAAAGYGREREDSGQPGSGGARVLVRAELPDGTGAGAGPAVEKAIRLCLGDPAVSGPAAGHGLPAQPGSAAEHRLPAQPGSAAEHGLPARRETEHASGYAVVGPRRVPCDLAAAGLRLMLIDTRVRRAVQPLPVEKSPVTHATMAIAAGDFRMLGSLLTEAHEQQPGDGEQRTAVSAARRAGALGGRAVADGPGRPVCLLVPADGVPGVRDEVNDEFSRAGYRPPRFLTFTPASGPDQPAAVNSLSPALCPRALCLELCALEPASPGSTGRGPDTVSREQDRRREEAHGIAQGTCRHRHRRQPGHRARDRRRAGAAGGPGVPHRPPPGAAGSGRGRARRA